MNDTSLNNTAGLGASPVSPLNPINIDPNAPVITPESVTVDPVLTEPIIDSASLPVTPPPMSDVVGDDNPFFRTPSVAAPVSPAAVASESISTDPVSVEAVGSVVTGPELVSPVEENTAPVVEPVSQSVVEPEPFNPTTNALPKEFWGPAGQPPVQNSSIDVKPIMPMSTEATTVEPITSTLSEPKLDDLPKIEPVTASLSETPVVAQSDPIVPEVKPLDSIKPVESVKPAVSADAGNNRLKNILLLLGVLVLGIISLLAGIIVASNQ